MTKKFVFDTNALISAHLLKVSVSRQAFNNAQLSGILVYSASTFKEFSNKLMLPKFEKYLSPEQRLEAIEEYHNKALLVDVAISITSCRDPKDNKLLELAVAANAVCIITSDKDLLALHPFRNISILSANQFLISNF